jgi:hypothetical protein
MDDHARGEDRALTVRLELHLDRDPICGRLRTDRGGEEQFVGWLGFVDALKRVQELERHPDPREGAEPR